MSIKSFCSSWLEYEIQKNQKLHFIILSLSLRFHEILSDWGFFFLDFSLFFYYILLFSKSFLSTSPHIIALINSDCITWVLLWKQARVFLHKKGSFNVRLRNAMASLPLYSFLLFHVLSAWKHQNQPSSHVKLSKDLKWTRELHNT